MPGSETATYPIVDLTKSEAQLGAQELSGRVNPAKLADEIAPIREAFLKALAKEPSTGTGIGLQTIEVSLTITAEGSLGFVKGSAEGSITLSFGRPSAG